MNSIEVKNLTKCFGKFTSVDNISFDVKQGEVFGFLGANGAGKSTTIKMLCGILEPSEGDATVGGFSIKKESDKVKQQIGYMSQKFSLYSDLTVEENINFFASVYGLEGEKLEERKKWVLKTAGLEARTTSLTGTLSTGYKQRLALGCAVIHEPKIVFLDEPTGGVDPISRKNFWDLINNLSQQGITVFVTTHYLDEAEFCNRIMMIDAGKIIAGGSPGELKTNFLTNTILELDCSSPDKAIRLVDEVNWIKNTAYFGEFIHITLADEARNEIDTKINDIKKLLIENNIAVNRINRIAASLEDVFVNLLEKETN
ncbi:MAG: ABC transporter ATP-binding protein [Chlorobi bacterium]|nr:ABC transporter ATP-binding protein [Chlorobiota bacterium]MCI0715353.1 ABC transporter ATP-binding protein [Chlorobiota bacterium]